MGRDTEEMLARFARHPALFAEVETVEEFAARAGGDGRVVAMYIEHPESWTRRLWRSAKAHGLDKCPHRPLLMPEAKSLSDLIEDVRFLPLGEGAQTRESERARTEGRVFVSGLSHRAGVPFGYIGGKREWSPEWLKKGEKVRRQSGGKTFGTYARPTKALSVAFDGVIGGPIGCLEVIRWEDGRVLCVAKDETGYFTQWAAVLDADKADAAALMPEGDRALIAENKAAEIAAWGE